jgi:cbb3-type cytochrome oxidase maturation protein
MQIIYFMIGVSLLMALGFLAAFFWAMTKGQNDDLYTPAMRMLLDDEILTKTESAYYQDERTSTTLHHTRAQKV